MRKLFHIPTLVMLPFAAVCLMIFCGQFGVAFAADAPPLGDSLVALLNAIKEKASAAVILVFVFQILRTHEVFGILGKLGLQGRGLQITIAVITALGFVADAYARGGNLMQAVIEGLFVSGGSMLIFDALKKTTAPANV